jgi:hypothetical protein
MTLEADQLFAFLRREVPPPHFGELSLATTLRQDLRMAEEDAESLLAGFFEEFGVRQGDFDFARYFPPEGSPFTLKWKQKVSPVPLTLGMLLHAGRAGVWDTAAIESEARASGWIE